LSSPRARAATPSLGWPARIGLFLATVFTIIALAVLPLLSPWFIHRALDAAGSAELLGLTEVQARALSDRSVEQLVLGGDFDFAGPDGRPFYDADERGHLGDARLLLGAFLLAGGIGIIVVGAALGTWRGRRRAIWRVVRRAGLATAAVVIVLGLISLVAFDSLFTLFHQVFFPGGNWSFDPSSQRLVQLYPFRFWQIAAAALGTLVFTLGLATWLVGRWASARTAPESTPQGQDG
jgi:integral membrane protein (TIGR01906 family)